MTKCQEILIETTGKTTLLCAITALHIYPKPMFLLAQQHFD